MDKENFNYIQNEPITYAINLIEFRLLRWLKHVKWLD